MFAASLLPPVRLIRSIVTAILFVIPFFPIMAGWNSNLYCVFALPQGASDPPPTTFTLSGFVRNQSNQFVSGVRVSISDENSMSIYSGFIDSSGRFTVKNIRQGKYTIRIETTGTPYEEYSQSMDLQSIR